MTGKANVVPLSFNYTGDGYKLQGREISVRVEREKFDKFPVFDKVKFTIQGGKYISLLEFKNSTTESVHYYHNSSDKITSAEIIYLKSKSNQPLVYSVTSGNKTTYYKQSDVKNRQFYHGLPISSSEKVADALINEYDVKNGKVTFRLDKKAKYNNIGTVTPKPIKGNYKEYTHKPRKGYIRNAFVVNNVDGTNLKVEFTGDDEIKIQDYILDGISVYFYEYGSYNDIPLMIKVNVNSKEHFYKPATGHDENWVKVNVDEEMKGAKKDSDIVEYLEKIKKLLFETVYVSLHKQEPYKILTVDKDKIVKPAKKIPETQGKTRLAVPGRGGLGPSTKGKGKAGKTPKNPKKATSSRPSNLNPKNFIQVKEIKCQTELGNYICFQHDLSAHTDPTQPGKEEHETGHGIAKNVTAYISNISINIHIKIQGGLAAYMGVQGGDTKEHKADFLFLPNHMLNVFFYSPPEGKTEEGMDLDQVNTSGQTTNPKQGPDNKARLDHIPLMFNYSNHWFKPRSIDEYFFVWDRVKDLTVPYFNSCKKEDATKIKKHLDEVNMMLNRVNLNFKVDESNSMVEPTSKPSVMGDKPVLDSGGKGVSVPQVIGNTTASSEKYGIPYPTYMNKSYNVNRIKVSCDTFTDDPLFISYTHKSINGFGIGTTCYRTKEISKKRKRQATGQQGRSVVTFTSAEQQSLEAESSFNYHKNLRSGLIHGVEEDMDGKVDVTANSVTVYFFNEDDHLNYPLLAEYDQGDSKYKYYVLKHGKDNELVSTK